jgi:hypothetical protein
MYRYWNRPKYTLLKPARNIIILLNKIANFFWLNLVKMRAPNASRKKYVEEHQKYRQSIKMCPNQKKALAFDIS